jgi:hypothetical protein
MTVIKRHSSELKDGPEQPVRGSQYHRDQFRQAEGLDGVMVSPAVSDEELAEWRDRMKLFEGRGADKPIAQYKLEIQFGVKHTVRGLPYGTVTVWENASHFNGGADALLYSCPGRHLKVNECEAIIPMNTEQIVGKVPKKVVICPTCFMAWRQTQLIGETFYRLPIEKWADVVHRWYLRLSLDADIRVKYNYADIRAATEKEQAKELRGEELEKARSSARRKPRVYPLEYIIKDVNAGADLRKRILAFLRD